MIPTKEVVADIGSANRAPHFKALVRSGALGGSRPPGAKRLPLEDQQDRDGDESGGSRRPAIDHRPTQHLDRQRQREHLLR
jgi:hypothetical protein